MMIRRGCSYSYHYKTFTQNWIGRNKQLIGQLGLPIWPLLTFFKVICSLSGKMQNDEVFKYFPPTTF